MNDVYDLKVNPDWASRINDSLKHGEGRFGWSYIETANLKSLQGQEDLNRLYETLTEKAGIELVPETERVPARLGIGGDQF